MSVLKPDIVGKLAAFPVTLFCTERLGRPSLTSRVSFPQHYNATEHNFQHQSTCSICLLKIFTQQCLKYQIIWHGCSVGCGISIGAKRNKQLKTSCVFHFHKSIWDVSFVNAGGNDGVCTKTLISHNRLINIHQSFPFLAHRNLHMPSWGTLIHTSLCNKILRFVLTAHHKVSGDSNIAV